MKPIRSTLERLHRDGPRATLGWLIGHGVPRLTGVPLLSFGRVTPNLFVGSQHGRLGLRWLARHGVTHVVSLRDEYDDYSNGLAPAGYCHLAVIDRTAPTLGQLTEGVAFIRAALDGGGKVYVHCHAGMGRAPTLAAAFLLSEGTPLSDALALLRRARPFIHLEAEQVARLEEYAASLSPRTSPPAC